MATTYNNAQLSYVDENGNVAVVYPVTKGTLVAHTEIHPFTGEVNVYPLNDFGIDRLQDDSTYFFGTKHIINPDYVPFPTTLQTSTTSTFNMWQINHKLDDIHIEKFFQFHYNGSLIGSRPMRSVNIEISLTNDYSSVLGETCYALPCTSFDSLSYNGHTYTCTNVPCLLYSNFTYAPSSGSYHFFPRGILTTNDYDSGDVSVQPINFGDSYTYLSLKKGSDGNLYIKKPSTNYQTNKVYVVGAFRTDIPEYYTY